MDSVVLGDQMLVPTPPDSLGEILLRDFMRPMGINQQQLSLHIGVTPSSIYFILNGRNRMSAYIALRLERAFGKPARFWLDAQTEYDLYHARLDEEISGKQWMKRRKFLGQPVTRRPKP